MKIIVPHKNKSKIVEKYSDIKEQAEELATFVNSEFTGKWKEALAISHCQVTKDPYAFFCVNNKLREAFGSSIIINAKIIDKSNPMRFKEACISYPHRDVINTARNSHVKVKYQVPSVVGFPIYPGGLKTIVKEFDGLEAFVIQHEIDHANGTDVYSKFKR